MKEKVLAAYRAGLRQLIMPKSNEKDLRDVPDDVQKQIAFTFVATMDEVLRLALLPLESDVDSEPANRADASRDTEATVPVSSETGARFSADGS